MKKKVLKENTDVGGKEGICPVCEYKTLNYGESGIETMSGNIYYYEWDCPNCKSTGLEWYDLKWSGHHLDVLGRKVK